MSTSEQVTPARRPESRASSPLAEERMQEKQELKVLNSRLERYIAVIRDLNKEKKELEARLAEAESGAGQETKTRFDEKMKELRLAIEQLEKDKAQLRVQHARKDSEKGDLEVKLVSLTRQLEDADRQVITLEQKIPHLEERVKFLNQVHDDEAKGLKIKIAEKEKEINQLKNHLEEELAKAMDKEKGEWNANLQQEKDTIIALHKETLERLELECGSTATNNANYKVEIAKMKAEIKGLNEKLADFRKENQKARDDLHKAQDTVNTDLAKLKSQVAERQSELIKVKAEVENKKQELGVLSTTNISLTYEMENYHRLLANEEKRLGLSTADSPRGGNETPVRSARYGPEGSKRRRLDDEAGPSTSKSPRVASPVATTSSTVISFTSSTSSITTPTTTTFSPVSSGVELGRGEVSPQTAPLRLIPKRSGRANIEQINVDERSIKVTNLTATDIKLDNWWIQVDAGDKQKGRFRFPSNNVLPGDSDITIKISQADESSLFNSESVVAGFVLQLLDDDKVISEVEVVETEGEKEGTFDRVCRMM